MTSINQQIILDRVAECYEKLVDETANPITLHHEKRNQRLNDLLELFEYVNGTYVGSPEVDKNPIDEWFAIPEDYQD